MTRVGTEGLNLFEAHVASGVFCPSYPVARHSDPVTSHAAAVSMRSPAHTQRLAILDHLGEVGLVVVVGTRKTSTGREAQCYALPIYSRP